MENEQSPPLIMEVEGSPKECANVVADVEEKKEENTSQTVNSTESFGGANNNDTPNASTKRPIQYVIKGNLKFKMNGRVKPKAARRTLLSDIFTNASFITPSSASTSVSTVTPPNKRTSKRKKQSKTTPKNKKSSTKRARDNSSNESPSKKQKSSTKRARENDGSDSPSKRARRVTATRRKQEAPPGVELVPKPHENDLVIGSDVFEHKPDVVQVMDTIRQGYTGKARKVPAEYYLQQLEIQGYRFLQWIAKFGQYRVVADTEVGLKRNFVGKIAESRIKQQAQAAKKRTTTITTSASTPRKPTPPAAKKKKNAKKAPPVRKRKGPIKTPAASKIQKHPPIPSPSNKPRTADQQAKVVKRPHENDVLLGRGNGIACHPGNRYFRSIVWQNKEDYNLAYRSEKSQWAHLVIQQVKQQQVEPRFLEHRGNGGWVDVPYNKLVEKACQALRERKWFPLSKLANSLEDQPTSEKKSERLRTSTSQAKKPTKTTSPSSKTSAATKTTTTTTSAKQPTTPNKTATSKSPKPKPAPLSKTESQSDKELADVESIKVGSRISVFWPLDNASYSATVKERLQTFFFIKYDDSQTEWIDLSKHSFKIIQESDTTNKEGPLSPQKVSSEVQLPLKPTPSSVSSDGSAKKRKSVTPQSWNKEEDEVLKLAVQQLGTNDWDAVATKVPGRNTKQVRDRWQNYVDPSINFQPLTADELRELIRRQQEFGNKWKEIATFLNRRTGPFIVNQWQYKIQPEIVTYMAKKLDIDAGMYKISMDNQGRFDYHGDMDGVCDAVIRVMDAK